MSEEIKFSPCTNLRVIAINSDGGSIGSQSVEALLMLAVLEKLEEIRRGIIDVENEIKL